MDQSYRVIVSVESLRTGDFIVAEETPRLAALVASGYLERVGFPPRGAAPLVITAEQEDALADEAPKLAAAAAKVAGKRTPKE